MTNQGWECPKCGKVWAPWMPSCDCTKTTITGKTTTNPEWNTYTALTDKEGKDG